jgi:predicted nucleic acid-binding protein
MSPSAAFIDAAHLIALLDRDEPEHGFTESLLRIELNAGAALVSSNYEVIKASLELQRRHGIEGSRQLLHGLVPFLHVEWCTRRDHLTAVEVHLADASGAKDLVDCVTAGIARRLGAGRMY